MARNLYLEDGMKLIFAVLLFIFAVPALSRQKGADVAKPLQIPMEYIRFQQNRQAYQEMIPSGLSATSSEAQVFNKFADRGVQLFFTSDQIKSTPLGRTADSLQDTLKTDLDLGTARTRHLVSFQILALQSSAQVKYSGWLEALFNMDFQRHSSQMELTSQMTQTRTLFLTHVQIPDSTSTLVGVRVHF